MRHIKLTLFFLIIAIPCLGQTQKYDHFEKGDLRLDLKLPHVNYLSMKPNGEFIDDQIGFNGYGIGIEYSYTEKKFIESSFSFVLTFEIPFPVPIDREYNKVMSSNYLSLTDNFVLNRFTLGYGLNYSSNYWTEWHRDLNTIGLPTTDKKKFSNKVLGVTLNSYYRVRKNFNLGIVYRPTFININKDLKSACEHLISFELNWKIRLN